MNTSKLRKTFRGYGLVMGIIILTYLVVSSLSGCKKADTCKTCTWSRQASHNPKDQYTVKQEIICDKQEIDEHDGKSEYVYDGQGNRVLATCGCE